MITLKKIQLNNFLSHSKTAIDFKPEQKLILDGKSGSGKSSIVEGLIWALFGKGRADNRSMIKRGSNKASVIIVLKDEDEDKEYYVIRSIDSKNSHTLEVTENGTPIKVKGVRETQEYLERKILHSSYVLFINSVVYPQENIENFVRQTAAKRKDIILEIINAADYDEYLKKAKEEIQKIKTSQEVVLAKIESKKNDIANNKATADKLPEYEQEETRLKTEIDTLKKQYEELSLKLKQISDNLASLGGKQELMEVKLKEYDVKSKRLAELNAKIIEWSQVNTEQIKKDIAEINDKKKKIDEYNEAKTKVIEWQVKNTEVLNSKPDYHDYSSDIEYLNKQLISLIGDTTGKCPKCGYSDPQREEKRQNDIKDLNDKLTATKAKFEALAKELVEYSQKKDALGTQPALPLSNEAYAQLMSDVASFDELNKKLIEADSVKTKITEAAAEIELIKAEQQDISDEVVKIENEINSNVELKEQERQTKDEIAKINGKIDELMMTHTNNNMLLGGAKYAVKIIEDSKKELQTLEDGLGKNSETLESLELLKEAFGQNGIKAIVIDYVIPQLEDKINNILSKLSDFRVKIETQKSGVGEDVVLEGLFITIVNDNNEEMDFDQYSGGEKIKISFAINESLAKFSKCNFRILDETIVALDNDSIQNFLTALEIILKDTNQMIIISHINEIKDMFSEKIEIQKINGDSKIIFDNV